ncbi:MAG: MoxR family ATPase [Proteobacteria bacterium]|nr:MoxR family ATPase [Pseudomonadota bacterium]
MTATPSPATPHEAPLATSTAATQQEVDAARGPLDSLRAAVARVYLGPARTIDLLLLALLGRGHALLEGVPGVAKTTLVKAFATALGCSVRRVQFTPDLLPSDITGTYVLSPKDGTFNLRPGPIFANVVLADEINRAPAKVQSALLEVMQERQVTIAGETHKVPEPFLVMATQNPIETEGTYPLPEAQVDRFMMKVLVDYPSEEEEFVIAQRVTGPATGVSAVATMTQLAELQQECRRVYVDPSLVQYAVKLVSATRRPERYDLPELRKYLTFGASPRATIGLVEGARALAFMRGRNYALPEDMTGLVADVLRHRLVLTYEALADGLDADQIVQRVMKKIAVPDKPLAPPAHASTHG